MTTGHGQPRAQKTRGPVTAAPWRYIPAVIFCAYLFYLSSLPATDTPPPFPHFDKVAHFCLYSVLGFLSAWAVFRETRPSSMVFGFAAGFCVLYGISDEIHQAFVPTRCPDVWDAAADAAGGAFGSLIFLAGIGGRLRAAAPPARGATHGDS